MTTRAERNAALQAAWKAGLSYSETKQQTGIAPRTIMKFEHATGRTFRRVRSTSPRVRDQLQAALDAGLTIRDIVRTTGISRGAISAFEGRTGQRFARARRGLTADHPAAVQKRAANNARAPKMAALFRAGYTQQQISETYGISRERVRQILRDFMGLKGDDGGQSLRGRRRRAQSTAAREARCMKRRGCTLAQVASLGETYKAASLAFIRQRSNAARRGIGWELTFWQWWCIWDQSGRWKQRGRGRGYVMCRVGDLGPYAVGNVFIATAAENSSTGKHKKSSLPRGVTLARGKRYVAKRMVAGKLLHLGSFATATEAHAAYLMAAPTSMPPVTPSAVSP